MKNLSPSYLSISAQFMFNLTLLSFFLGAIAGFLQFPNRTLDIRAKLEEPIYLPSSLTYGLDKVLAHQYHSKMKDVGR